MKFSRLAARCASIAPHKAYLGIPLLVMAALYWLSSLPGTPLTDEPELSALFRWVPPSLQNALHIPAYAVLAWAWRWALDAWLRAPRARVIAAFSIASVYGFLDEWHQSFVPGRYASLTDVALDVAGAGAGIWVFHKFIELDQYARRP